jgi:hypothetical protein
MPLAAGTPAPAHSVYGNKSNARKNPVGLVVGIGLALVAVVAVTLVAKGGGDDETPIQTTLAPVAADGWRNFSPPDRAFVVSFPGTPNSEEGVVGSLNEKGQKYSMKDGDFEFGVIVTGAFTYIAPHEAGAKLDGKFRPTYEGQGAAIEAAGQLITPRGDQAFDIVFVLNGVRTWNRFTTWGGNVIRVYATLPAEKQPTAQQSTTYSRLRDSVHQ